MDVYLAAREPYTAALLNCVGTTNVAEAALIHGVKAGVCIDGKSMENLTISLWTRHIRAILITPIISLNTLVN